MPELCGKKVTNAKLRRLNNLSRIKSLHLYDTAVDDDGIEVLAEAQRLEEVHISSDKISDRSMPVLCSLPSLASLLLDGVPMVTNAGIAELKCANQLSELYLNGTQLDDDGVGAMLHLSKVWSLSLSETQITDISVAKFGVFTDLSILTLSNTGVTGAGLSALSVKKLYLYLEGCPVRDEGVIANLRNIPRVEILGLSNTLVTDECVAHVSGFPHLSILWLNNTAVTDEGVSHLMSHPSLSQLYVEGTNVSDTCVKRLKKAAPKHLSIYI